jgi:dihydroorotate dehydrogenase electron transfer subunit
MQNISTNTGAIGQRGIFLARAQSNQPLCAEHFRLVLEIEGFPDAAPGQFVQILCADPVQREAITATFIRRPFSIGGLRRSGNRCELDIYHRVVGPGTRWMGGLRPGDCVDLLGPLGRPFEIVTDHPVALLVGGGIGLPPLIWLAEALRGAGKETIAFVGARSGTVVPLTRRPDVPIVPLKPALVYDEFARFDTPVVLATNDGSIGSPGYIPDAFSSYLKQHAELASRAVVYACGPDPMMRAVARTCERHKLPCFVCLERVMACGMGTCQSCVVAVRDASAPDGWRYRLCCTDGPVFDSRVVLWNDAH